MKSNDDSLAVVEAARLTGFSQWEHETVAAPTIRQPKCY